jgi:dTDP-glucose 4,6-dehydratase
VKHILVTGGAGFMASHLCDALLDRGYAASALDNLSTSKLSNLKNAFKSCIQEKNLNAGVARIFNTYEARMRSNDRRIIPQWMYQLHQEEGLTVHATGKQTRSSCYIDDLILGILTLLESSLHEPLNLGNPQESSLLELHAIFSKLFQRNLPLHHLPERPEDLKRRCPDITQAREKLLWSPSISLEQGLTFKSNDAT